MLPDSMRIHVRKCNARTPQKPSKRRLRERRLNPPKQSVQSNRQVYQSNKQRYSKQGNQFEYDTKAMNMPKYKSQRNTASNGYSKQYNSKLANSQRNREYESNSRSSGNQRKKPSRQNQPSRRSNQPNSNHSNQFNRKKKPNYNNFEDEYHQNGSHHQRGMGNNERQLKGDPDIFKKLEAEGPPPPSSMSKCRVCGRTFASDRIAKHQKACVKASKKPKKVKRFHKALSKREKEKIKKSRPIPKWKQQHSEFIKQMKYMKKLKKVEEEGGDIRMLEPPPTTENPDLIPCKFCGRKFRAAAHERHENICQKVFGGKKGTTRKTSGRNISKKGGFKKGKRRY